MDFRNIDENNFDDVLAIYKEGIETGIATFETELPDWKKWDSSHLNYGRIIVYDGSTALGWAALSPVSSRCVYGGVAEVSVYVSSRSRGKGIGSLLLNELIQISEQHDLWTLQSSIFRENEASKYLHLKCGFREIGYKEKIGQLKGVWYDNILLERRSKKVGSTKNRE